MLTFINEKKSFHYIIIKNSIENKKHKWLLSHEISHIFLYFLHLHLQPWAIIPRGVLNSASQLYLLNIAFINPPIFHNFFLIEILLITFLILKYIYIIKKMILCYVLYKINICLLIKNLKSLAEV